MFSLSSLATTEIVKMTISREANDANLIKTFPLNLFTM